MDYGSDSGENYYAPTTPPEQVVEQTRERDITIASLPLLEKLIKDCESEYRNALSIVGMQVGGGINTDAQILAKGEIAAFFETKLKEYKALYESVQPTPQEAKP